MEKFNLSKYCKRKNDLRLVPKIKCEDGFEFSCQASFCSYCTPDCETGPWTHFELGFPNMSDELIFPFAEDENNLTDTVYPYVPEKIILSLIKKHGGIKKI